MARGLTKKRRGFVKDYVKMDENGTKAALANYDTDNPRVAEVIASELLSNPIIQQEVEKVKKTLAERIPDELLEKVHIEGLNAKQFRFSPEGEMIQVDDFATRHKYLDSGYKLKGIYAPEKHVNMNVSIGPSPRIKALADKLLVLQSSYEERNEDDAGTAPEDKR